ncbi:hypothetical protein EVAR_13623_1 [Eumeta japonica]|uniref:Uncharacterized protein n=1 Tax=Eumeta variegata TaxID=151549 RepID=A0A4C1UU04_EUMVA|nr:hypothetical protein EVAR_13623_1 [Eumeta japonica]
MSLDSFFERGYYERGFGQRTRISKTHNPARYHVDAKCKPSHKAPWLTAIKPKAMGVSRARAPRRPHKSPSGGALSTTRLMRAIALRTSLRLERDVITKYLQEF